MGRENSLTSMQLVGVPQCKNSIGELKVAKNSKCCSTRWSRDLTSEWREGEEKKDGDEKQEMSQFLRHIAMAQCMNHGFGIS